MCSRNTTFQNSHPGKSHYNMAKHLNGSESQKVVFLKPRMNEWGLKGALPLGCLPLWGREGVTLAIP
jgi:hypothetical protein